MKKMMKIVIGIVVAVVVLLVLAVGVVVWKMDSIAKAGIEAGGTYALGVDTTVDNVSISLMGGTVGINDMTIANPKGFETPYMMNFKKFHVGVETGSLFSDVVHVPSIELDDLTVNIEQAQGTTNVKVISGNLQKLGSGTAEAPKSEGGSSKKLKIDHFIIKNITANVQTLPIGGKASTVHVNIPVLNLDNVSSDQGVPMAEVIKRVWPAILAAIVSKGGDVIPKGLLNDLQGDLTGLAGSLGGQAGKLMGQVGGDFGKQLQNVVGGAGGAVQGAIGNILGGNKDKTTTTPDDTKKDDTKSSTGDAVKNGLQNILGGNK